MDQCSVSSSYWKTPDSSTYLSAVAAHETDPLVAVASGCSESNLYIYELDVQQRGYSRGDEKTVLTHHQTITLPGIHSLAWASPHQKLGSYGNVLASGHKSGLVHLTLLPDPSSSNEPAEILRRFNHNKHLSKNEVCKSTRIKHLSITSANWRCCADSSIMSLFNEAVFLWDPSRSDVPVLKKRSKGTKCLHPSPLRDGVVSTGGAKGVSIMDLRVKDAPALSPPEGNDSEVSMIKWSPHDENYIASVHDQTSVKVWDIRAGKPVASLDSCHSVCINDIAWSLEDHNEFQTASSDGTVKLWDLQACIDMHMDEELPKVAPLNVTSHYKPSSPRIPGSKSYDDLEWLPKPLTHYKRRLSRYDDIFLHSAPSASSVTNPAAASASASASASSSSSSSSSSSTTASLSAAPTNTTVFSNNKEFVALTPVRVNHENTDRLISIDNDGFFGLHTKHLSNNSDISSESQTSEDEEMLSSVDSLSVSPQSPPPLSMDNIRTSVAY